MIVIIITVKYKEFLPYKTVVGKKRKFWSLWFICVTLFFKTIFSIVFIVDKSVAILTI